jgi:hypothetical protein
MNAANSNEPTTSTLLTSASTRNVIIPYAVKAPGLGMPSMYRSLRSPNSPAATTIASTPPTTNNGPMRARTRLVPVCCAGDSVEVTA